MALTRRVARPFLAAPFVLGGIETLRNPAPKVAQAADVAPKGAGPLGLPQDTEKLVKINSVVQIVGGLLLACGRFRRLTALALAGSLVPTTLAGHAFWKVTDPAAQSRQKIQFSKNLGLLGGLILELVDTEGAPSLGWRAKRAARKAKERIEEVLPGD
ncbi:MAG: DoxX family protein [Acidimicrobiales bacterium]